VVILDWALTDCLTRAQRRHVTMLVLMLMLHDADGVCAAVEQLRQHGPKNDREQARLIRELVERRLEGVPLGDAPGALEAMRLLDGIALAGARLPASLLMFRKAAFTLEGVLEDVAGAHVKMDAVMAQYALSHWMATAAALVWLLTPADWLALEWSVVTLPLRALGLALRLGEAA
jgi:predicted unusual protein kinase regulating ubiquinone biosynthesis (AarF/ABC1/UbiB family)